MDLEISVELIVFFDYSVSGFRPKRPTNLGDQSHRPLVGLIKAGAEQLMDWPQELFARGCEPETLGWGFKSLSRGQTPT